MARRARKRRPEAVLRSPPGPAFRQERSRRSYHALLDAALELFGTQEYDAIGTPEIAAAAGVSVGTFYRYFDDKRDVYLEVMRRTLLTAYAETLEQLTPEHFVGRARRETITAAVAILFHHVLDRPALTRSFMEMSLRDKDIAEVRRAFEQLACDRLTTLIGGITPREVVPDPEAFAYVLYGACMQCAYGVAVHLAPPALDRTQVLAALATIIERALFSGGEA